MPVQMPEVLVSAAGSLACLMISFVLSTVIIRVGIPRLDDGRKETKSAAGEHPVLYGLLPESSSRAVFDFRSTGLWIGFCETLLIFVLVYAGAFSALAIIIGAKQFVRKEEIQERPSYYLLGTLVNLCIAVLFALAARVFFPVPVPAMAVGVL